MKTLKNRTSKTYSNKFVQQSLLPMLIAAALSSNSVYAQQDSDSSECEDIEGTPPGLYVTTDEGRTFLTKDGKTVELAPGEAAFADENRLTCIKKIPKFLDWPCSTDAASSRKFATYTFDELETSEVIKEVVQRYFDIPEVIEPIPDWVDGESTTTLTLNEIIPYATPEFWYQPNADVDPLHEKRPRTLQISLYVGINLVVLDNYQVDVLDKFYAGQPIPVVFVFNDSNVVPVSYFGTNVSLEEINKAFNERQIKLAEVPMWPLGDSHFSPTGEEFDLLFELPEIDDINPLRREALEAQLETYGFSRKPIFVTMMEGGRMYVDDPDRVRVALNIGLREKP